MPYEIIGFYLSLVGAVAVVISSVWMFKSFPSFRVPPQSPCVIWIFLSASLCGIGQLIARPRDAPGFFPCFMAASLLIVFAALGISYYRLHKRASRG